MDTFHNNDRGSVLREIDAVAARGRQDWRTHPGIAAWFEDENDLLQAIAAAVRREHALLARVACVQHSSEITQRASVFVPEQRKPWFKRLLAAA
jgi:hypothetical protein